MPGVAVRPGSLSAFVLHPPPSQLLYFLLQAQADHPRSGPGNRPVISDVGTSSSFLSIPGLISVGATAHESPNSLTFLNRLRFRTLCSTPPPAPRSLLN